MSTKEEIRLIIQKNLPAEVGAVLKERLEKAEQDERSLENLKSVNEALQKREKELLAEIEKYKKFDERNKELDAREQQLGVRIRDFEVLKLNYELAAEKDKTQFAKDVALGLVRNSEYRKQVFDSENQAGYYQGSNWVTPTPVNKSLTETKKAE
jgi:hypothetical protein